MAYSVSDMLKDMQRLAEEYAEHVDVPQGSPAAYLCNGIPITPAAALVLKSWGHVCEPLYRSANA